MDKDEYKDEKAEKSGNQKRKSLGRLNFCVLYMK